MKEFLKANVVLSSDSEELKKLAKKKGIVLPSDHLGAFKTVYAQVDGRANRNGVRLSREAVEKALPTLIGSQVNINHWRENWTVGSIFWAKVNDNDEIEIAFTFFKDVYIKEYEIATALFEKGELTVSFELKANPDAIEFHKDGTRTLNDITFVGSGLLLDENPAEPTAIVFEMAKRFVTNLIENDTPELVYAKEAVLSCQDLLKTINKALEEKQEKSNTTLDLSKGTNKNREEVNDINIDEDLEEGGNQMKNDEEKKVEDVKAEETSQEAVEEKDESKVDKKVEESTEDKAKESTEEKVEEKAELEVVTKIDRTIVETMDENSDTVEDDSEVTRIVKRDGEVVSEEVSETTEKTTFTFAEVEAIKKAIKIEKIKAELGEYVKGFSDEDFDNKDKLDNARLRKENASLKDNKEVVKASEEDEVSEEEKVETASLETGHEENSEVLTPRKSLVKLLKSKK